MDQVIGLNVLYGVHPLVLFAYMMFPSQGGGAVSPKLEEEISQQKANCAEDSHQVYGNSVHRLFHSLRELSGCRRVLVLFHAAVRRGALDVSLAQTLLLEVGDLCFRLG